MGSGGVWTLYMRIYENLWQLQKGELGGAGAENEADERRRKAMHVLIQDVRTSFWRMASAQKLRTEVQETINLAEDALKDARKAEAERLRSPVDALRYQRQLLENLRLLESIEQELSSGRVELAHLINAPLSQVVEVSDPGAQVDAAMLNMPVERMEELAVMQNDQPGPLAPGLAGHGQC